MADGAKQGTKSTIVSDEMAKKFATEKETPYTAWIRKEGLEIASETAVEAIHDEEGDLLDALILTLPLIEGRLTAEHEKQARVEAWVF